jgi:hypothetical protein
LARFSAKVSEEPVTTIFRTENIKLEATVFSKTLVTITMLQGVQYTKTARNMTKVFGGSRMDSGGSQ